MVAAARAGTVRLRDGRALGYAEWGPPDGRPVLHFHGVPDGRLSWGGAGLCGENGVRLIAVDRPGVGESDPKLGRLVGEWPADVELLAEQLGLDRFAITAWSGGGPYALASAHALGPRIDSVVLIGGSGRLGWPEFPPQMATAMAWRLAARAPWAMTFTYTAIGKLARRSPGAAHRLFFAGAPKVDRTAVSRPETKARLMAAYVDATRCGGRGLTEDMRALLRPWGFDPAEIRLPVHVVHGARDEVVPLAHAEYWIETLQDARPSWIETGGHYLTEECPDEIFKALAE